MYFKGGACWFKGIFVEHNRGNIIETQFPILVRFVFVQVYKLEILDILKEYFTKLKYKIKQSESELALILFSTVSRLTVLREVFTANYYNKGTWAEKVVF